MQRRLFIIFGYLLVALAIVGFTVGLVAYGNDYSYDFATHSIIQRGTVIIESIPGGVSVTADGKQTGRRTRYQVAFKVGGHTFELEKDGFWPWEKVLNVVAGRVSLVNYVVMVPKSPASSELDSKTQIVAQDISKDHRHLAYITGGADAALYTLDLGNRKVVKLYVPKAAVAATPTAPATPAEVLQNVTWSDDASHLLIASDMGGAPTHRLAAASGGEPGNLTQTFGFNLAGLQFSGNNWRQLYWVSPDGLRRLDVEAATVSGVLADKVSQFWVQPDRVLYVQQTELGRSLWSLDSRGKKQELIQALVESDSYSVAFSRYNGTDELAVAPSKTGVATLYSGIFGDTPVAKVITRGVSGVNFSPDGHLLALTSGSATSVYDLEQSDIQNTFVIHNFTNAPGNLASLTWFDNYHLLANRDGELWWSEFDGANAVDLGKTAGGLPAYSDADRKAVIMFKPTANAVKLTSLLIRQ